MLLCFIKYQVPNLLQLRSEAADLICKFPERTQYYSSMVMSSPIMNFMIFLSRFHILNLFDPEKSPKIKKENSVKNYQEEWLGCFRIQNAVIILGFWHLFIHLFGFVLFIGARFLMPDYCSASFYGIEKSSTLVQSDSYIFSIDSSFQNIFLPASNFRTWFSFSFFSFIATCFLIHGAIKKISIFILPFLLIQVFDILFDVFIIGMYTLLSSTMDEFFIQLQTPTFKHLRIRSDFHHQQLFILIFLGVSFSIKIYLTRIVYLYYKSLISSQKRIHT